MSITNRDHRCRFKDVSRNLVVLAATDPAAAPFIAGRAGYTIFIQRIAVHVEAAAAKYWRFQDNSNTPLILAQLPASAAVGDVHVLLESEEGVPLAEGKQLDLVTDGAGVAGSLIVEGYIKPTGVLVPSQI